MRLYKLLCLSFCMLSLPVVTVQAEQKATKVAVQPILSTLLDAIAESSEFAVELVVTEDAKQAMLNGVARIAITKQRWTDREVSDFEQKYGVKPVMLYFAATQNSKNDTPVPIKDILAGIYTDADVYHLYTIPKELKIEDETLANPMFGVVVNEQDLELFEQHGFIPLPQGAMLRNRVSVSLDKPTIEGGYR